MAESGRPEICPRCGIGIVRDYSSEGFVCSADSYRREIHSDALAVCESQRAEHQRLYPDIPLDSECRPVLSNFRQHEDYMKKRGAHKLPSRKQKTLY